MQYMAHLPPKMLARFTQLDYDRELAGKGVAAPHAGDE
jgi:hypothetical protein